MRIKILGEIDESRPARATIGAALEHSAAHLGYSVEYEWKQSEKIVLAELDRTHGVFIAPGSPAEENQRIIEAIKLVREEEIPCIGTCGGFQRLVTEYALNELTYEKIEHQEIEPSAVDPLFAALSCSLLGKESDVFILQGSLASSAYGASKSNERFFCSYGIGDAHRKRIESMDLRVTATDINGEPRIIEHVKHPFFVGTLFVPQVLSTSSSPHPLITAFLKAAKNRQNQALQATSASARRLS